MQNRITVYAMPNGAKQTATITHLTATHAYGVLHTPLRPCVRFSRATGCGGRAYVTGHRGPGTVGHSGGLWVSRHALAGMVPVAIAPAQPYTPRPVAVPRPGGLRGLAVACVATVAVACCTAWAWFVG